MKTEKFQRAAEHDGLPIYVKGTFLRVGKNRKPVDVLGWWAGTATGQIWQEMPKGIKRRVRRFAFANGMRELACLLSR